MIGIAGKPDSVLDMSPIYEQFIKDGILHEKINSAFALAHMTTSKEFSKQEG